MIKRIFLLLVLQIATVITASAENVTVQTAQRAAQSFINSKTNSNLNIHLIDFAEKASFPNLYVFGNDHCFIIIAADDAVHPVLGYSIEGGFGTDLMPNNTYEWLMAYNEEISIATENRSEANDEILSEWDNLLNGIGLIPKSRNYVDPLLRTKWNQDSPFNDLCPVDSIGPNGHCYTGCVATTMAQIMNYWEHPVRGIGNHSYTPHSHPEYGVQSANFGGTTYDWDNMKNYYSRGYTETEALAVATLMYHCGVALNTEYNPTGTGGNLRSCVSVLTAYFDYTSTMEFKYKSFGNTIYYSDSLWIEMLKQELDLDRPVPYRGSYDNGNSGHAFICDGYDENDCFHFNWGWSGKCDGYYLIGAINPQRNDTENVNNRAYNRNNAAIFNCYPKTPSINPPSNVSSVTNERNVTVTWNNVSNASYYKLYRDGDLIANNLSTTSYTDSNVTYGNHSYYLKSVKSDGIMSLKSNTTVADVHFPGPMPSNLQTSVSGNDVSLSWQNPTPENAILQYGTGNVIGGSGYDGGTYWAHRYPLSMLSGIAGMAIEKVAFYFCSAGTYLVSIYKGDISNPTELMHQQSYNATAGSWQEVVFSTPVIIDYTKDLWIVFYSEANDPASYCSYSSTGVEDASLYSYSGLRWHFMTDRSWLIKTYITDGIYTYNLNRDGNARATNINGSSYTDSNVPVGFYDYNVTTNYFCGESDPSNTVRVRVGNPPCSIYATASPSNGGTIHGGGTYNYGQTCTLTATPATGYDFINWTKNGTQVTTSPSYSFTVMEETATYVAHFQLQSFSINASVNPNNCGTVNGGGTYNYGQTCTLTATPATGYDFIKWTKNGTQVSTSSSYSFNVTEAATYVAHFQLQSFAINTSSNPNSGGTITGGGTYNYGQICTLTATPATGYDFIKWTKNGTQVSTNTSYSFTVTEAATYIAHFQLQSFSINVSADPSNGGTVSGNGTYDYGQTCTLTATPAIGYDFIKWTKNGAQVSTNASYSFTVTEAATYMAHFQLQSFTINVSANPNNGGAVTGEGIYDYGQNCTLTATPATGYNFINWTENGNPVSNQPSYTFTVTTGRNLVANFTIQNYIITAIANPTEGGTVSGSGGYDYGQTCTLTATSSTGYDFIKWTHNGMQISTNTSYSFTVTEAANYVAHFQLQSFTINASANPSNGGSVSGGGTYDYGQTCTLTATPATGYDFINWTKNGTPVYTSTSYSFTVTEAANFVAHFQLQSFTINPSADPYNGGTVSGGGTYDYGQTCTLTATPATGYDFINWTKNGTQVSTNTNYSFTVTEAAEYVAHFQLQSFIITASVTPSNSGEITGEGTYDYGETCTLAATPVPGYSFLRWTKNGTQVSTNAEYSFSVTEAASFVAHFQLNNYIIAISANPSNGGTVSGGGAFHYGDNCTVTATTNSGFNFINWTENGNPVSNQTSYTFTITSDRSLVANFTTQNYIITAIADPTDGGIVSGAGGYNYGDNCTLSTTPNTGYIFQRWTQNGTPVSTDPTYSFNVTESATFVAQFTMESHTVNVAADPSEGGIVSGGGTFDYGQTCTVHASANIGFAFVKWMENGIQVSDQPDYSFTVTDDHNLVAYFTPMSYEITAEADPQNGGTIIGAGIYLSGEIATLNVVPNENYHFQNWTEGNTIVSESATYTFSVDCTRHLVAHFLYFEGIDEDNDAIEVFPNPATDKLYIIGIGIKRVMVYNTLGQLVEDREVAHQDMILLNVSRLKTGYYILQIESDLGLVSKVFVKNR